VSRRRHQNREAPSGERVRPDGEAHAPSRVRVGGGAPTSGIAIGIAIGILFLLVCSVPSTAQVSFGIRGGYSDIDEAAFAGSDKIGATPLLGMQILLPIVPLVSLVIAAEQRERSLDFGGVAVGELQLQGHANWSDQTLFAAARLRSPGTIGLYGGGGIGLHRQKAELSHVVQMEPGPSGATPAESARESRCRVKSAQAEDPLSAFLDTAQKESDDLSWHAFAGLDLQLPMAPVSLFAEGRIDDIEGRVPHSLAAYGGLNLRLP
jgi:hypothetical protein